MLMVEVLTKFRDKDDVNVVYEVGTKLDWKDKARIEDCKKRGLIRVIEVPKKKAPTRKKATKKG